MTLRLCFWCDQCRDENKHRQGTPGYVWQEPEHDSLGSLLRHWKESGHEYVDVTVEEGVEA